MLCSEDGGKEAGTMNSAAPDALTIPAKRENLDAVQSFVAERVEGRCSVKTRLQIDLAVEEIFVNIASYAYAPGEGMAEVSAAVSDAPARLTVTFRDSGVPYDPTAKQNPDVSAMAQDRQIGGLGIFLTKRVMDEVRYEYRGGQNVLTMIKKL